MFSISHLRAIVETVYTLRDQVLHIAQQNQDLFRMLEEEIAARLRSLLASNCSRLEVVVMPRPPEGRGTGVTRVWDNFYESRSKHRRDGLGNLELSVE